ncbi:unnamed protein product [Symbiodinium necroappetens]|uniref:Uncharacterized protein n=1 Tax=Symbiodinium necroappetens TaxID=1628268 RepID=A0A812PK29_9DINO|nr:unnamed protein product [Symbiodinium necroappetens]
MQLRGTAFTSSRGAGMVSAEPEGKNTPSLLPRRGSTRVAAEAGRRRATAPIKAPEPGLLLTPLQPPASAGTRHAGPARNNSPDDKGSQSLKSLWRKCPESQRGRRRPSRAGLGLVPGWGQTPDVLHWLELESSSGKGLVHMLHFRQGVWRTWAGSSHAAKTEANSL